MTARKDGYLPLRDYALLGDCHGAALVGRDGAVDWFCPGRFDAQPVCWALLDADKGASFRIAPSEPFEAERAYLDGTNILCTTLTTSKGRVKVTDFLPVRSAADASEPFVDLDAPGWLVRVVEALEGRCDLDLVFDPGACAFDPEAGARLDMRLFQQDAPSAECVRSKFTLLAGERRAFVLAPADAEPVAPAEQAEGLLHSTADFWREWTGASRYDGPYRAAVERSALALKALTYAPTGAIVAAPTTSLPEEIGGERNWDYRYSWLRDSAFILQALGGLGYHAEAGRYCEFLGSCCVQTLPELRILYGIEQGSLVEERCLYHLDGYAGSKPVRVGNAAVGQAQLDIYGEVADWALGYRALGGPLDEALRAMLEGIADHVAEVWSEPDQGIWEMRGQPRQYVHGKAMAWVALDRAIRLLGEREAWCQARQEILDALRSHADDGEGGGLRQTFADGGMDAALLLLPMLDLPLSSDALDQTVRGVERSLREGDYVLRYRVEDTDDGLSGKEGAFLICSFWLVDALLCTGRADEARSLFERLLDQANDVGLYAEEVDPEDHAFLGNFPQAFTHLALINSAINLDLHAKGGGEALLGTHADRTARAALDAGGDVHLDRRGDALGQARCRDLGRLTPHGSRESDQRRPMMSKTYDLIVIGSGTAATTVAKRVSAAGRGVAVTDFRPYGGTCALRGCDPKKMLIGGTSAADHARRMHGKGVEGDVRIDWRELLEFKRGFTDPVPEKKEKSFSESGIATFHGRARFVGPNAVEVDGETLEAKNIVLATGAEPMKLGIPGEEYLIDNEGFLEMESLPRRVVLVGGGYIAAEFSHIAARAGAEVTILQHGERMLKGFDPDLVGWLMEKYEEIGVTLHTDTEVERIERTGETFRLTAGGEGGSSTFEADLVVHAAGRKPDFASLDLEAGGVELRDGKLALNEYMQSTSNQAVYAAGDTAQMGPPLTPVSNHDGKVVAANLLEGNHSTPNYKGVPSVAFTLPPIARVGLDEVEAREQGLKFRMQCDRTPGWFSTRQQAESVSGYKVLVEEGSERILGAHLLGPHADEVINVFTLAVRHGLTADHLKDTMFAYPTGASDVSSML